MIDYNAIAEGIVNSLTFQMNDRYGSIWYCSFLIIGDYRITLETASYKNEPKTKFVWYRTFDEVIKEDKIRLIVTKEFDNSLIYLFQNEEITINEKFVDSFDKEVSIEVGASTIVSVDKQTTIDIVAHLLRIKKFRVVI